MPVYRTQEDMLRAHEDRLETIETWVAKRGGPPRPQIGDALEVPAGLAVSPVWMAPYGQAVSRADYAALFAVIGTYYGAGNGSTTFNLPDLMSMDAQSQFLDPRFTFGISGQYGQSACSTLQDTTFPGVATQDLSWMNAQDYGVYINAPTAADSFVTVDGDGGALRNGMKAGKTYVFSATGSVRAAISGELTADSADAGGTTNKSRARALVVHSRIGSGSYNVWHSPQVPTTVETGGLVMANEHRVSVEFTLPAGTTEAFLRFYLGGSAGAITWTRPTLIEKKLTDPAWAKYAEWFDGYTKPSFSAHYLWSSTADASYPVRIARVQPGMKKLMKIA